jgi:hypothetical protein
MNTWDEDAMFAGLGLIERTGAKQIEIGYLHDDVPAEEAGWYAHARYHGARVTAEDHPGPVEAVEALARRLLTGALCVFCGREIAIADFPGRRCRYTRQGQHWVRGCVATHHERIKRLNDAGMRQARGPQRKRRR